MGSKNYSYDLEDLLTGKIVGRITKIRGLCLQGEVLETINTNQMLEFVQAIQEDTVSAPALSAVNNQKSFFRP